MQRIHGDPETASTDHTRLTSTDRPCSALFGFGWQQAAPIVPCPGSKYSQQADELMPE
jgi:hypothetical protein